MEEPPGAAELELVYVGLPQQTGWKTSSVSVCDEVHECYRENAPPHRLALHVAHLEHNTAQGIKVRQYRAWYRRTGHLRSFRGQGIKREGHVRKLHQRKELHRIGHARRALHNVVSEKSFTGNDIREKGFTG